MIYRKPMSELAKLVGANIRRKRLERGLTLEFLGELLHCSHQLITHYENGFCQMPYHRLAAFSNLCRLPVDWFFLDEGSLLVYYTPL